MNKVYELINERMLDELKCGNSWHSPFPPGLQPRNYVTGNPYRFLNAILAGIDQINYKYPYWVSRTQAIKQDIAHIHKGEKSTQITFWSGRVLRIGRIWNVEQVVLQEGSTEDLLGPREQYQSNYRPVAEVVEEFSQLPGLPTFSPADRFGFDPGSDTIYMPTFDSMEETAWFTSLIWTVGKLRIPQFLPKRWKGDIERLYRLALEIFTGLECAESGVRNALQAPSADDWEPFLTWERTGFVTAAQCAKKAILSLESVEVEAEGKVA